MGIIFYFCVHGMHTKCMHTRGQLLPLTVGGRSKPSPGKTFFTVGIFRKNTSKYAKQMVEQYARDILKPNLPMFFILTLVILRKNASKYANYWLNSMPVIF